MTIDIEKREEALKAIMGAELYAFSMRGWNDVEEIAQAAYDAGYAAGASVPFNGTPRAGSRIRTADSIRGDDAPWWSGKEGTLERPFGGGAWLAILDGAPEVVPGQQKGTWLEEDEFTVINREAK